MDREVGLTPPREVLDIAVSAVFRAAWDSASAFEAYRFFECTCGGTGVDVFWFWEVGDDAVKGVGCDEVGLAAGPVGEDLGGWSAAHDSGVDQAGEADVGDVAGGAEDAFKVPDGYVGLVSASNEIE